MDIPKPDGGTRPLGVAAIEDKVVQKAVTETILTPIYEAEFLGFSYGFRRGRGAHGALDALAVGLQRRKINWVADCDIRAFFDTVSRDWLVRFLEYRIGDKRVIRLIIKWLNAGVMEAGEWRDNLRGTPQPGLGDFAGPGQPSWKSHTRGRTGDLPSARRGRHPREEPDALNGHVRICAGGAGQPASLPQSAPSEGSCARRASAVAAPQRPQESRLPVVTAGVPLRKRWRSGVVSLRISACAGEP